MRRAHDEFAADGITGSRLRIVAYAPFPGDRRPGPGQAPRPRRDWWPETQAIRDQAWRWQAVPDSRKGPAAAYEPWMRRALQLAWALPDPGAGDPPVGAVVFGPDGTEIAAAHHDRERRADPTAHAEILALRRAGRALGTWKLDGCTLVTTLEPGAMSAGAVVGARIQRLVIGSWDPDHGAVCSRWDLVRDRRLNHVVEVIPEVLRDECDALLARAATRPRRPR